MSALDVDFQKSSRFEYRQDPNREDGSAFPPEVDNIVHKEHATQSVHIIRANCTRYGCDFRGTAVQSQRQKRVHNCPDCGKYVSTPAKRSET